MCIVFVCLLLKSNKRRKIMMMNIKYNISPPVFPLSHHNIKYSGRKGEVITKKEGEKIER